MPRIVMRIPPARDVTFGDTLYIRGNGYTLRSNIFSTLVGVPPRSSPPLSVMVTLTTATPCLFVAGVNERVPCESMTGGVAKSRGVRDVYVNVYETV